MPDQSNREVSRAYDGSVMRLYSGPLSMFGGKAQIALLEKGLPHELVMVPFDMQRLYEPKNPDVLRVNPKRQVPVLVHGEVEIFDSTQIFEYLEDIAPEPPLWPRSAAERARARRLELQSDEVYFPHIIRLMALQENPSDQAAITAREAAANYYDQMEATLASSEYLAGRYGYADIAFYMAQFFGHRMGAPIGDTHRRLIAWRQHVSNRQAVRQVIEPMAVYLMSQGRGVPDWLGASIGLRPT
jgi:glutathione S-transferase